MNNDWPAARIVHLMGGCRAINDHGPAIRIIPKSLEGVEWQFEISAYPAIYRSIQSFGFLIVGVDFYSHVMEVDGSVPPNWRSYYRREKTSWATEEVAQKWRNIGHAGGRMGRSQLRKLT